MSRKWKRRSIALIGICVFLGLCVWPVDRRAFTTADSWYSPPPPNREFTPLAKDRFAQVDAALQAEGQGALAEVPVKRITAAEAARLTGKPLPIGEEYVLLRALVLNEGTGGFYIGVGNGGSSVHVEHDCLGRGPVPMKRKAVVAVLQSVPKTVFVSCGMAE